METIARPDLRAPLRERRRQLESALTEFGDTAHLVELIREVDAALERINTGTFGLCEVCHDPIEEERILADPLVRVCLGHLSAAQQRALERDLELASSVQRTLLPRNNLRVDGWEIAYHYAPAGLVSGDYCDLIPAPDGPLLFVVGDVSGKGVAASMLMAHLHALFHGLLFADLPVSTLVARANRLFCESTLAAHYATLVGGWAAPDGSVTLCNAGHWPPLLVQGQRVTALEATGLPIGLFCEGVYSENRVALAPGDTLMLYTDGLSEARRGNEEYGPDRVAQLAAARREQSPTALVRSFVEDVQAFQQAAPPADDLTIMVLRRTQ